ncbi:hypothetical protein NM208_g2314 [Fusarium decemcellulare]|uniref:Uncharacterized protein n=1 Tax=Fusarium decemcellulare TaxID=57161 RepID=A0ACC1ST90_9HYPO|nr:hypothetical protein NM208_g2314 [Fusarium decemcellulare]
MSEFPTCRWGIVATGLISSWFVADLVIQRSDAKANHVVQAIGSSSLEKGQDFAAKHCPNAEPTVYASYEQVYADQNVDCVYIGTPHAFHKKNCLDAISAGKNVLCEKPFTINAREATEVLDAARKKGVYVAEAMWLRHRPMVLELRKVLFEQQAIGDVVMMTSQYALPVDINSLPPTSRYKDPGLGAGSLLDVGIYPLTWAIISLEEQSSDTSELPYITASQTHVGGVEVTTSVILKYSSTGRHGILNSTFLTQAAAPDTVCRIQGSSGFVDIIGKDASHPSSFIIYRRSSGGQFEPDKRDYPHPGQGFTF